MNGPVEAVVRVGSVETTYVRAGHGLPVLLLVTGDAATVAESGLFLRLAAEFRVVGLILEGTSAPIPLPDLLEGLGLDHPLEGLGMDRLPVVAEFGMAHLLGSLRAPQGEGLQPLMVECREPENAVLEDLIVTLRSAGERRRAQDP